MNTTTRRYPRTLEEACGPYARNSLYVPPEPMTAGEKAVAFVTAVFLITAAAFAFL